MKRFVLHLCVVLFCSLFFFRGVKQPKEEGFHFSAFAELPVKYDGRKKPIDTLARNFLTILSGRQSARRDDGSKLSAVEWFLDNVAGRPESADYRVFRIENRDVLSTLGLEERAHFRYSYRELVPGLARFDEAVRSASAKSDAVRDLFDKQVLKIGNEIYLYKHVMAAFEDPSSIPSEQLIMTAQRYMTLENYSIPLLIPPHGDQPRWKPLMSALLANHPGMAGAVNAGMRPDPFATKMGVILAAYRAKNVELFNSELAEYREQLEVEAPAILHKLSFEVFYNRLSAFMKASELYLLVFILSCFGWMARKDGLLAAALTMMIFAFAPHTLAIVARVFLSGYPPVTNLYSSAIFIGWGSVLAGIILELGFRKKAAGIGSLVGSIAGFSTLLIAHFLAGDGDTLEQMRAVLDTRFWLATHVITITLGYMGTFVAGTIGIFYILAGLFTRRLDETTRENMYRMMYGVTCFALLLSFVGTVLGGLWADDSWGRFWGWDPKENGALLIVLWNAIILHARYGKMVNARGVAVMVVFGNIITAWSWFGVNQLGVGLHSYGFIQSAAFALTVFVLIQLAICALGLLPTRLWKSSRS